MRLRTMLALAIAIAPSAAAAAPKAAPTAGGKAASACGVKALPLVVGNEWTYQPITAPNPVDPELAKIVPVQPKKVVISVQSIAAKGTDTVVSLQEKITTELKDPKDTTGKKMIESERTVDTQIVCGAKKFEIGLDSFFFAGEPGGSFNLTFDNIDRKGTSWAINAGLLSEATWREDIIARWASPGNPDAHAKSRTGKLELERVFTPEPEEQIGTPLGVYKAEKVALVITGRVTLDGVPADVKPSEMPANWLNTLWFSPETGVVQVVNKYAHAYQLTAAKLK